MAATQAGSELSEAELTARARAGDVDAFERLVQQSAGKALAGARRILGRPCDAEDALQSGVLKAMQRLESFRGESRFGTWLHSIVVRTALDMLRARRERGLGGEADGEGPCALEGPPGGLAARRGPLPSVPRRRAAGVILRRMFRTDGGAPVCVRGGPRVGRSSEKTFEKTVD